MRTRCLRYCFRLMIPLLLYSPSAPIASAQTNIPDSVAEVPIDLSSAFRLAGEQSPRIAIAEASAREAAGQALSSLERFLPTVSGELTLLRHEGLTQGTQGEFVDVSKQSSRAAGRISALLELDKAPFELLEARRHQAAAANARERVEDSTLLAVASAYFDLLASVTEESNTKRLVDITQDLVNQSERGLEIGTSSEIEVARFRAQLTRLQILWLQSRETAAVASARLASLLTLAQPISLRPVDEEIRPLGLVDTSASLDQWLNHALNASPSVAAAEQSSEAARWRLRQAVWGPLLPRIEAYALMGSFGPGWNELRDSRNYGVSMKWTIGPNGLLDLGRIRSNSARVSRQTASQIAVTSKVSEDAVRTYYQVRSRAAIVRTAEEGAVQAERTLSLALQRRELGIGPALEVIDATELLVRSLNDRSRAIADYNIAQLSYLALTGQIG